MALPVSLPPGLRVNVARIFAERMLPREAGRGHAHRASIQQLTLPNRDDLFVALESLVISTHLPSVIPVWTGTTLALPCSTNEERGPLPPLLTACGGTTSALGISLGAIAISAKVPGRRKMIEFGRSISTKRLRVEGSAPRSIE